MTVDHFEQLVSHLSLMLGFYLFSFVATGAMLVPSPVVGEQYHGAPLLNQILAVRAHVQHLGDSLARMLQEKTKMAVEATSIMFQHEGPMDELEEVLLNTLWS